MQVHVVGPRVLVEREEKVNKTESGIYLPETSTKAPNRGKIVAVGGEVKDSQVKEGVVAVFGEYAGMDMEIGGRKVTVLNESDIICVLN